MMFQDALGGGKLSSHQKSDILKMSTSLTFSDFYLDRFGLGSL